MKLNVIATGYKDAIEIFCNLLVDQEVSVIKVDYIRMFGEYRLYTAIIK